MTQIWVNRMLLHLLIHLILHFPNTLSVQSCTLCKQLKTFWRDVLYLKSEVTKAAVTSIIKSNHGLTFSASVWGKMLHWALVHSEGIIWRQRSRDTRDMFFSHSRYVFLPHQRYVISHSKNASRQGTRTVPFSVVLFVIRLDGLGQVCKMLFSSWGKGIKTGMGNDMINLMSYVPCSILSSTQKGL